MNSDAIRSDILRIAGIVLAWAAGRYHLSNDTVGLIMSDIGYVGAVAAFVWGMVDHWNKKKVPVQSTAIVLPGEPSLPVGTNLDLTPLRGTAKVVG